MECRRACDLASCEQKGGSADGDSFVENALQRKGQPLPISPAHPQLQSVLEYHDEIPVTTGPYFTHPLAIDQRGAMNARKFRSAQSLLHRRHGMPHEIAFPARMNADVITF